MCVSRSSGELVWSAIAGSGYRPGKEDGTFSQLDSRSNYSSPSPVASRNEVVFFYGNGDLVCFNHKGKKEMEQEYTAGLWDFCFQWTFSASPTLWNDLLYLPVLQRDEQVHGRGTIDADSFLLCLNISDGKNCLATSS